MFFTIYGHGGFVDLTTNIQISFITTTHGVSPWKVNLPGKWDVWKCGWRALIDDWGSHHVILQLILSCHGEIEMGKPSHVHDFVNLIIASHTCSQLGSILYSPSSWTNRIRVNFWNISCKTTPIWSSSTCSMKIRITVFPVSDKITGTILLWYDHHKDSWFLYAVPHFYECHFIRFEVQVSITDQFFVQIEHCL